MVASLITVILKILNSLNDGLYCDDNFDWMIVCDNCVFDDL